MLPIRDTAPSRGFAWTLFAIVLLNTVIYACQALFDAKVGALVGLFGLIPSRFVSWTAQGGSGIDPMRYVPLATSMFLHDGWLHLLSNMVYLWTFGRAIEGRVGRATFVGIYLFSGVVAAMGQLIAHPHSNAAMIGASGAIAGVLGAYLLHFGAAKITVAFPFLLIPWVLELRASWFLLGWFGLQVGRGTSDLLSGVNDPAVAWWAHATGFVAGLAAAIADEALAPALASATSRPTTSQRPSPAPSTAALRPSFAP